MKPEPSSVFLETHYGPNYSVRKIKDRERDSEWKRRQAGRRDDSNNVFSVRGRGGQ